jgi:hypothetical protein
VTVSPRPPSTRAPGRPVRLSTIVRLLAAGALGVAAAMLISCGSSTGKLIPAANAGPLQGDFEAVAQAAESGDGSCTNTEAAILKTEQDFAALPSTVDSGLRNTLRQGISNLRKQALQACKQPLAQTTTTPAKTTTTTKTTPTTPTTTQTTSTPTTTPTTPTTPTPSGPGGGTPAPEGETPSKGGGTGEAGSGGAAAGTPGAAGQEGGK